MLLSAFRKLLDRGLARRRRGHGYRPVPPLRCVDLGRAWSANSVNCVSFRAEALVTVDNHQYGAFYRPDGRIDVFKRPLDGGAIQRCGIAVERLPADAHQSISLGVDAQGFVHLAYGAHASHLSYARGTRPHEIDAFLTEDWSEGGGARDTYPMFLTGTDGSFRLLYREGAAEAGDIRVRHWNPESQSWTIAAHPLIRGRARERELSMGPYLNRIVIDDAGRANVFIVWRAAERQIQSGLVNNVGLDFVRFSADCQEVESASGFRLTRPAGINASERVIAVPHGRSLINQAGATLLPDGEPCAVTYWAGADGIPQFRFVHRHDGAWRETPASDFTSPFRLEGGGTLPLPHSRPAAITAADGRVAVLFRSAEMAGALCAHILAPPHYALSEARRLILLGEDLGFYEPVIDYTRWRDRGVLSMFVQRCAQPRGDKDETDGMGLPCRIVEWAGGDIFPISQAHKS